MPYVIMIDNGRQYSDHWHFPAAVAESETVAMSMVAEFQRWVDGFRGQCLMSGIDLDHWRTADFDRLQELVQEYCLARPSPLPMVDRDGADQTWELTQPGLTAWCVKVPEV